MPQLLEVRDLSVRFAGVQAVQRVNVDVGEWEIVGLIGPNGAGKTALLDCVTGIRRPDGGRVVYRGQDVTRMPAHRRVALGVGRTWQELGADRRLTVLDNVLTAQHAHAAYSPIAGMVGAPASFAEERRLRENAEEILFFLGLLPLSGEVVAALPEATQRLCDLAMALATDPDLLILDEPSAGMGREEAVRLGETLRLLRDALNVTILVAEHHGPPVIDVCDFVYCLIAGRVLASGGPEEILGHPSVAAAYVGEESGGADGPP